MSEYIKALQLLELNPYHPSLRLHSLQGQLAGLSSVSINRSYRLLLVNIGSYDQVY